MRLAIVGLCALLAASTAVAQSAQERALAHKHFEAGELHFQRGDYETAAREFEEAWKVSGLPDLLYNMGRCHEALRRWDRALAAYRRYLDVKPGASDRPDVEARIALIETAVAAPATSPPATADARAERQERAWRPPVWSPWVALGVAVVAAGAGAYFALRTLDVEASEDDAEAADGPATIAFGVAGVAGAASAALFYWMW